MNSTDDMDERSNISTANSNHNARNDSFDNDPALERINDCSQTEMVSLPLEVYRKIVNATVELYKAKETIAELESLIQKKDDRIKHLEAQLETAKSTIVEHFSHVSHPRYDSCYSIEYNVLQKLFAFHIGTK